MFGDEFALTGLTEAFLGALPRDPRLLEAAEQMLRAVEEARADGMLEWFDAFNVQLLAREAPFFTRPTLFVVDCLDLTLLKPEDHIASHLPGEPCVVPVVSTYHVARTARLAEAATESPVPVLSLYPVSSEQFDDHALGGFGARGQVAWIFADRVERLAHDVLSGVFRPYNLQALFPSDVYIPRESARRLHVSLKKSLERLLGDRASAVREALAERSRSPRAGQLASIRQARVFIEAASTMIDLRESSEVLRQPDSKEPLPRPRGASIAGRTSPARRARASTSRSARTCIGTSTSRSCGSAASSTTSAACSTAIVASSCTGTSRSA